MNGIERLAGEFIMQEAPAEAELALITRDLQRSECSLERRFVPDKPGNEESTKALAPVATQAVSLRDGAYYFTAACPSIDGKLEAEYWVMAADGQPERCLGFEFQDGPSSASTITELTAGMVGRWGGCVTTPWTPMYWVEFTFRADGGYSAVSEEVLDGEEMRATYYGMEADHPGKQWVVLEIVDGEGSGGLDGVNDLVFSVVDFDVREARLMGDALRFELVNVVGGAEYGPLTFRLFRH